MGILQLAGRLITAKLSEKGLEQVQGKQRGGKRLISVRIRLLRELGKLPALVEAVKCVVVKLGDGCAINPLIEGYARLGPLIGRESAFFGDHRAVIWNGIHVRFVRLTGICRPPWNRYADRRSVRRIVVEIYAAGAKTGALVIDYEPALFSGTH